MRCLISIDVPDDVARKHDIGAMGAREFASYLGASVDLMLKSRIAFIALTPETLERASKSLDESIWIPEDATYIADEQE